MDASPIVIFNAFMTLTTGLGNHEMINGGYGYHAKIYQNLVALINQLDVKKIKNELGLRSIDHGNASLLPH